VLKKPDSISLRDHYFMMGVKDGGSPIGDKNYSELFQNSHTIVGVFFGETTQGRFIASWAGHYQISLNLIFSDNSATKTQKYLIIDVYNKLRMKFEYSEHIPFIGFANLDNFQAQIFPPKVLTKTRNSLRHPKR
jgi:hypothetical protein